MLKYNAVIMLYFCIQNGNSYHYYESHSLSIIISIIHLIDIVELIPLIPSSPVAYWMAIGMLPQNLLSDLRKFCAWARFMGVVWQVRLTCG